MSSIELLNLFLPIPMLGGKREPKPSIFCALKSFKTIALNSGITIWSDNVITSSFVTLEAFGAILGLWLPNDY